MLRLVEAGEVVLAHEDLAPDVDCRRNVAAGKHVGDRRHGPHVGGHVFPFEAVAAGRRLDELGFFVAQRDRQPVDLRLGGELQGLVRGELQKPPHAREKLLDRALGEGVVERQHRHPVPDLAELLERRRSYLARGRIGAHEGGKPLLDFRQPGNEGIVFRIRNSGRVLLVIAPVMFGDLRAPIVRARRRLPRR